MVVAVSALPIAVEVLRARRHRAGQGVGPGPQV